MQERKEYDEMDDEEFEHSLTGEDLMFDVEKDRRALENGDES